MISTRTLLAIGFIVMLSGCLAPTSPQHHDSLPERVAEGTYVYRAASAARVSEVTVDVTADELVFRTVDGDARMRHVYRHEDRVLLHALFSNDDPRSDTEMPFLVGPGPGILSLDAGLSLVFAISSAGATGAAQEWPAMEQEGHEWVLRDAVAEGEFRFSFATEAFPPAAVTVVDHRSGERTTWQLVDQVRDQVLPLRPPGGAAWTSGNVSWARAPVERPGGGSDLTFADATEHAGRHPMVLLFQQEHPNWFLDEGSVTFGDNADTWVLTLREGCSRMQVLMVHTAPVGAVASAQETEDCISDLLPWPHEGARVPGLGAVEQRFRDVWGSEATPQGVSYRAPRDNARAGEAPTGSWTIHGRSAAEEGEVGVSLAVYAADAGHGFALATAG